MALLHWAHLGAAHRTHSHAHFGHSLASVVRVLRI
jgi:hypothetical protein